MVITEPVLEENISAIKKGTGFSLDFLHIDIITGVKSKTTASFTKKAEAIPVIKTIIIKSLVLVWAKCIVFDAKSEKKPSILRVETIIIIPNKRAMVLKSIALIASSKDITPKRTIATAPVNAAEGRSIFTLGRRVNIIPR